MLTCARSWFVVLGLTLLGVGCRGADSTAPVDGHLELCCKAANPDNVSFVGCRASGHCRATEEVWVRGPITCTAPDASACAGGRCCALDLGEPSTEASTEANPETNPETELEPQALDTAAPAPITPLPYTGGQGDGGS